MTGEQPYKMRLATYSVPLYKVLATAEQLARLQSERIASDRMNGVELRRKNCYQQRTACATVQ